jgi:hypothetical protein
VQSVFGGDRVPELDWRSLGYYGLVVAYACWQLLATHGYRPDARLLPTVVGVSVLGLVALRGVAAVFGGAGGLAGTLGAPTADEPADTRRAVAAIGWVFGLVVLLFVVGLLPALGLFVFAFVAVHRSYRAAAAASLGTLLFVYLLFVVVLDAPTFEPLLLRVLGVAAGG